MADPTYNLNGGFKPTMKRFADLSGPDFFQTPPWATFALIDNEKFEGEIWESACGDGAMSRVLAQTGQPVPLGNNWEAHHAHSVAAGGHDGLSNCVAMCSECHWNTHTYGRS